MKWLAIAVVALAACKKPKPAKPDDPKPGSGSSEPAPDAGTPEPPKPAVDPMCANRPEKAGPFILDATLAKARRGTGAKTYVDVELSKEQPIELCGLLKATEWLEQTKCPDGSVAEQLGRVGSVGRGGRCNNLIEKYKVRCPDGSIDIYLDVLFCGPGETM